MDELWSNSAKRIFVTISVSRKFACDEVVRLTDERDAPAAKRSGRVSEANCVAAARPRVRSFRVAKVARVRARFRGLSGEKELSDRGFVCWWIFGVRMPRFYFTGRSGIIASNEDERL